MPYDYICITVLAQLYSNQLNLLIRPPCLIHFDSVKPELRKTQK